jgi:hypothetical protein
MMRFGFDSIRYFSLSDLTYVMPGNVADEKTQQMHRSWQPLFLNVLLDQLLAVWNNSKQ